MSQTLIIHPQSSCAAITDISVDLTRPRAGRLELHYQVKGRIADLRLPRPTSPRRSNELWQHTCFEAFLRAPTDTAYYEFNFAPSTQWAVYRYDDYRAGMTVAPGIRAPRIETQSTAAGYSLEAVLDLEWLPGLLADTPWRLGLAAVIEEEGCGTSYWALAHPPGEPDFHHADGFVYTLGAAPHP